MSTPTAKPTQFATRITSPTRYPTTGPGTPTASSDSPTLFPTMTSFEPTITFSPTESSGSSIGTTSNDDIATIQHTGSYMFDYAAAAVTISLFAFLVSSMFVFICLRTGLFDTRKKPYGYKGKVVTYVSPAASRGDLEEQQMDTATEETSLLGTYRKGDKIQEATVVGLAQPVTANSFYEYDLDIVDREFLEKFLRIMILGMRVKLHTTRGPREIIVTIVKDEMRWEQVRVKKDAPKKRYKLKFPDITDLEMGKATNTFINNAIAQDKCSLSVVTEKASLDIEADSTIERNCLFRGLQLIIRQIEIAKEKDQNNVKK